MDIKSKRLNNFLYKIPIAFHRAITETVKIQGEEGRKSPAPPTTALPALGRGALLVAFDSLGLYKYPHRGDF